MTVQLRHNTKAKPCRSFSREFAGSCARLVLMMPEIMPPTDVYAYPCAVLATWAKRGRLILGSRASVVNPSSVKLLDAALPRGASLHSHTERVQQGGQTKNVKQSANRCPNTGSRTPVHQLQKKGKLKGMFQFNILPGWPSVPSVCTSFDIPFCFSCCPPTAGNFCRASL